MVFVFKNHINYLNFDASILIMLSKITVGHIVVQYEKV